MNPPLIAALAVAGLLAGYPQRAIIASYTPAEDPQPEDPQSQPRRPPWPAIGAVTAILLATLAARIYPALTHPGLIHPGLILAAACWFTLCAVPLAFTDAAVRRLPDRLTGAAYAGTFLLLLAAAAVSGPWSAVARAFLGGLALAAFYFLLVIISPSGMGLGDVKLAASVGVLLAWFGWPTLLAGGVAGFLLAGLSGIALLVTHRATRKQQLPFGPFMIAGALAVLLAWPAGLT
ncbi:MAG: A24 family peptidase [Streptosporangiaceae bacterium]